MLRITVVNQPNRTRLKLEGKLAHEWVVETERAWAAVTALHKDEKLTVDLLDVTFVDEPGERLLARMRHAGAELIGSGPLLAPLIDEIEKTEEALESEDETLTEDWQPLDETEEEFKQ